MKNEGSIEYPVSKLELFFDLVFVFALIHVTAFLSANLTWIGLARGVALLAVLWQAWVSYAWLTDAIPAEEVLYERITVLTAIAAMLIVSLAVPWAFGTFGVLFGVAYFIVRALQVLLYATATDPEGRHAILRLAPGFLGGPALLVAAGFFDGFVQAGLWVAALAIDYGAPLVAGVRGLHLSAEHFVERNQHFIIIALGESVIAIGFGASGQELDLSVVLGALFGIVLVADLWWMYFDYAALVSKRRLTTAHHDDRATLSRNSYSYLHLPMVTGIVFVALGIKHTIAHMGDPLGLIPAVALYGGGALFLLGQNAFRLSDIGSISISRLVVAGVVCVLIPVVMQVPAFFALAALALGFAGLAAYETTHETLRREVR